MKLKASKEKKQIKDRKRYIGLVNYYHEKDMHNINVMYN